MDLNAHSFHPLAAILFAGACLLAACANGPAISARIQKGMQKVTAMAPACAQSAKFIAALQLMNQGETSSPSDENPSTSSRVAPVNGLWY